MFPLARYVLNNLKIRNIQQLVARQNHTKEGSDFHDKYGNAMLLSGASFCVMTFTFYTTQMGVMWNPSPVGRVIPKEWKDM